MKHIVAPRIQVDAEPDPQQVKGLLDRVGVQAETIGTVNWGEFPYRPEVKFRIAHTGTCILLHYVVNERTSRAAYGDDLGQVWTDSCVEFFSSPADDGYYYNLETNCIGTVLLCCGKNREGREAAPGRVLDSVKRYATLGRQTFDERPVGQWELSLVVPSSFWFKHDIKSLSGLEVTANFYKCGDELSTPHFLSWNPITIDRPDFHRPDFFGRVRFE